MSHLLVTFLLYGTRNEESGVDMLAIQEYGGKKMEALASDYSQHSMSYDEQVVMASGTHAYLKSFMRPPLLITVRLSVGASQTGNV